MPELPDVEVFRRYCARTSLRKKIKNVNIRNRRIIRGSSPQKLKKALINKTFKSTKRYGKNLFLECGRQRLFVHFGMTGFFKYFKHMDDDPRHDRFRVDFANGYHLAYVNQRLLGRINLIGSIKEFIREKKLGPDAKAVTFKKFKEILEGARGTVKSNLMNQEIIAGLGNIYADEVLYQAKLIPRLKTSKLKKQDIKNLFGAMKRVLRVAIERKANPAKLPDTWLLPYRKRRAACPRCHSKIKQVKIGGRTSYFCPGCQRSG